MSPLPTQTRRAALSCIDGKFVSSSSLMTSCFLFSAATSKTLWQKQSFKLGSAPYSNNTMQHRVQLEQNRQKHNLKVLYNLSPDSLCCCCFVLQCSNRLAHCCYTHFSVINMRLFYMPQYNIYMTIHQNKEE